VFYLDDAYVLQVFQTCVPSVLAISARMLQVLYLDVLKVNLVLQQVFYMFVSGVSFICL
jgi:hypothetical protein